MYNTHIHTDVHDVRNSCFHHARALWQVATIIYGGLQS